MTRRAQWLRERQHRVIAAALFLLLVTATLVSAQNLFPGTGMVGIGTTTPVNPLNVVGTGPDIYVGTFENSTTGTARLRVRNGTSQGSFEINALADGSTMIQTGKDQAMPLNFNALKYGFMGGNFGVGTTSPVSPLNVVGSGPDVYVATFENSTTGTARLRVRNNTSQGSFEINALADGTVMIQTGKSTGMPLNFAATSYGFLNGNFGIGTKTPQAHLHVTGNAQIDGNIAAKYQDVAEWVKAPPSIPAGTVVIINAQESDSVVQSETAYDTRVAGVVSAKPGILLGEAGGAKAKIAHSGRVKVKVDASYGPISVGDLLVTSPTPGHVMRSEPVSVGGIAIHRPGTLIGKALEPLSEGQGEILVLVTLQ